MKVVVIGLGSMGRRRIRLIQQFDKETEIVGVDTNEERKKKSQDEYEIKTFSYLEDAIKSAQPECAFVCTSPLTHSSLISKCLDLGLHIFTELNLVADGYEENILLAEQKKQVLFMSSTFLYREEIKKIKSLTERAECVLNYTYHVGQYLPDWHPWEDYKDFFVASKSSNGCREIFAIELPWLTDVFGEIAKVDVVKSKISSLDLDYDDNYLVIIQHKSGHKGTLAVDIVSRKAVRNLEVFGENLYLYWDGTPIGLTLYDIDTKSERKINLYEKIAQLDNYSSFIVENAYLNEIVAFFEAVTEGKTSLYSFEKDKEILDIIDRIEA